MSKTILLADDSVTIQKVIELTFMDQDHRVETVGSGDAAIARLGELKPDFVITDVHMPGADGYEVARRSKALYPDVPVLLLVGTFEPFDEGDLASSGADEVLKKPFDSQELMRLVTEMSPGSGGAEESESASDDDTTAASGPTSEASSSDESSAEEPFSDLGAVDPAPPAPSTEIDPFDFGSPAASDSPVPDSQVSPPASKESLEPVSESVIEVEESPAETPQVEPVVAEAAADDAPRGLAWEDSAEKAEVEVVSEVVASEPEEEEEEEGASEEEDAVSEEAEASSDPPSGSILSDEDIERIARRVADLVGEKLVRQVAWDVIPDMAEVVIRERLQELESQVE